MCLVQLPSGSSLPVHNSWMVLALTEIQNPVLRDGILSSDRFESRIVDFLSSLASNRSVPLAGPAPSEHSIELLAGRLDDSFQRQVGILWFAPAIAPALLDSKQRSSLGIADREELQLVMRYRSHVPPPVVGDLDENPDYLQEGARCITAWLDSYPDMTAASLVRLGLPATLCQNCGSRAQRAALVEKVLADEKIGASS